MKKLLLNDNLHALKEMPNSSVNLIVADPPFNSGKDYGEFTDKFDSMAHYIYFMKPRIVEMHRVLKASGSLYLHCDSIASHYLKMVCDNIFNIDNYRCEIFWKRDAARKKGHKHNFPKVTDTILLYGKSEDSIFTHLYKELDEKQRSKYRLIEKETGRAYKAVQLGGYSDKTIYEMKKKNLIHTSKNGQMYKKYYLDEAKSTISNLWIDIPGFSVATNSPERTGYPTQKPIALYERMILASTLKDHIVLDPFCGSGASMVAAEQLGRKWVGIDMNSNAIETTAKRLADECGILPDRDFEVHSGKKLKMPENASKQLVLEL